MPALFNLVRWRTPILMASVSMSLTVAIVSAFACWEWGFLAAFFAAVALR
jgi:hypothetical protein